MVFAKALVGEGFLEEEERQALQLGEWCLSQEWDWHGEKWREWGKQGQGNPARRSRGTDEGAGIGEGKRWALHPAFSGEAGVQGP